MFCTACGNQLSEGASFCSWCGARATHPVEATGACTRLELLADLKQALNESLYYEAEYGHDTDLVISSIPSVRLEAQGMHHTEYSAVLKAVEHERTAFMWETLRESSGGISLGGVESELRDADEMRESAEVSGALMPEHEETSAGQHQPGWDYRQTRDMLAGIAEERGWTLSIVLQRQGATW